MDFIKNIFENPNVQYNIFRSWQRIRRVFSFVDGRQYIPVDFGYDHNRFHIATELRPIDIPQRYGPAKHSDPTIAFDKHEEGQSRLVLLDAGRPNEALSWSIYKLQAEGFGGLSYWCRCPHVPGAWRKRMGGCEFALFESQAVVLTTSESDELVGSESVASLSQRIERLWGGILPESVFASDLFREWLSYFIKHNHDFGIVHAWVSAVREWLRFQWHMAHQGMKAEFGLAGPSAYMGNEDGEVLAGLVAAVLDRRIGILDGNPVIAPDGDQRPRRIWDVCANRVVPTTWFPQFTFDSVNLVAISHAWVASAERKYVLTGVNCRTWPVPMPRDVEIDGIRQELLQRNIRFAWLDILCLRQGIAEDQLPRDLTPDPSTIAARKSLQSKEWVSDVPLIGAIYRPTVGPRSSNTAILVYLNGVGRPLTFAPGKGNWRDERHWLRRAWTLQETPDIRNIIFAGCELDKVGNLLETHVDDERYPTLGDAISIRDAGELNMHKLLIALQDRCASNPVDVVGGILYFCMHEPEIPSLARPFPAYHSGECPDVAWTRLVHASAQVSTGQCLRCIGQPGLRGDKHFVAQLLRLFPHPSAQHWFPSWAQVMKYPDVTLKEPQLPDGVKPDMDCSLRLYGGRLYRGVTLTKCKLRPEAIASTPTHTREIFRVTNGKGSSIILRPHRPAHAPEQWPIIEFDPAEQYVLVDLEPQAPCGGSVTRESHSLVVCRELTAWKPPRNGWDGRITVEELKDPGAYHYRLRRVTSLDYEKPGWLPFSADLQCPGRRNVLEGRDVYFWDPSIVVTLQ